ncbi:DUF2516 family protein [Serinibacter arcticus]|uniref:DUF2516 family protein n=1 Tax=Serinibacter arcticus TaxID=1655435 RepID=UPI0013048F91|nr:DUF2516 family protein [Serinibacter arcticus]
MTGLIQYYVFVVLFAIGFLLSAWALIDAVRRPARSYVSAEKRTKPFWVGIVAAGTLFGYLSIPQVNVFGFLVGFGLPVLIGLIAVLPGAIYLADVKPEVIRYTPRSPGSGSSGPTGRW